MTAGEHPPSETDRSAEAYDRIGWFTLHFKSVYQRSWLAVWGIAAPAAFLLAATTYTLDRPEWWQSGSPAVLAILMHHWPNAVLIHALLLPASYAMYRVARFPDRPKPAWIGFALASGAVLWLELFIAWIPATQGSGLPALAFSPIVGSLVPLGVTLAYFLCKRIWINQRRSKDAERNDVDHVLTVVAVFAIGIFVVLAIATGGEAFQGPAIFVFFGGLLSMFFATPLALATYGWQTYRFVRSNPGGWRVSLSSLMLIFTWLSANVAAWTFAYRRAVQDYATLPTEQPDGCFIASAAARGHRRVVGADASGVNRQLRTLKAGEVVLRQASPPLHRRCRWVYNRFAPPVARRLANPWLATAAYLALKPAEWIIGGILACLGVTRGEVDRLYRGDRR
ncbi:MAG: DUF6688 family protein [Planctomycetota bacterium]